GCCAHSTANPRVFRTPACRQYIVTCSCRPSPLLCEPAGGAHHPWISSRSSRHSLTETRTSCLLHSGNAHSSQGKVRGVTPCCRRVSSTWQPSAHFREV